MTWTIVPIINRLKNFNIQSTVSNLEIGPMKKNDQNHLLKN